MTAMASGKHSRRFKGTKAAIYYSMSTKTLDAIVKDELRKHHEPVTHIDPATIDLDDLIRRATR